MEADGDSKGKCAKKKPRRQLARNHTAETAGRACEVCGGEKDGPRLCICSNYLRELRDKLTTKYLDVSVNENRSYDPTRIRRPRFRCKRCARDACAWGPPRSDLETRVGLYLRLTEDGKHLGCWLCQTYLTGKDGRREAHHNNNMYKGEMPSNVSSDRFKYHKECKDHRDAYDYYVNAMNAERDPAEPVAADAAPPSAAAKCRAQRGPA